MKKILSILSLLVIIASCSKDDEVSFSVSQEEVSFEAAGGEYIISVDTEGDWYCSYDADWIIVREKLNNIRIIAQENPSGESRTATIQVSCNGSVRSHINVTQDGVSIDVPEGPIDIDSEGAAVEIELTRNMPDFTIECSEEWLNAEKDDRHLLVFIKRNYDMADRTGTIKLTSGLVEKTLSVNQKACQWYESFEMIDVEGATFYMGSQRDNASNQNYDINAYPIESPVHKVTLDSYSIGAFEVSQAQWIAAMGTNPSLNQGDRLPVENVTWEQVQEFISVLNKASGLTYRLPTEAEWEFAAKGGAYSEGNKYSGFSVLGACGWYYSNSESSTHEIGTKYPNELGIYDMSGNVREWCSDWFDYYTSSSVSNPKGASNGNMKINRGGSWTTPAVNCRNTYRHTDFPTEKSQDLGFRLVLQR